VIFLPDTNVWIRFLNPGKNQVKVRFLDRSEGYSDRAERFDDFGHSVST